MFKENNKQLHVDIGAREGDALNLVYPLEEEGLLWPYTPTNGVTHNMKFSEKANDTVNKNFVNHMSFKDVGNKELFFQK